MRKRENQHKVELMDPDERDRIDRLLRDIGGPHVSWGSIDVLNVWLVETRMEADRRSARRIELATWALVLVTFVLAVSTVGLIIATVQHGG